MSISLLIDTFYGFFWKQKRIGVESLRIKIEIEMKSMFDGPLLAKHT